MAAKTTKQKKRAARLVSENVYLYPPYINHCIHLGMNAAQIEQTPFNVVSIHSENKCTPLVITSELQTASNSKICYNSLIINEPVLDFITPKHTLFLTLPPPG